MLLSIRGDIRTTAQMNGVLPPAMGPEERLVVRLIWGIGLAELLMESRMARSRRRRPAVPCPSPRIYVWRLSVIFTTLIGPIFGRPKVSGTRITCAPVGGAAT